MIHTDNNISVKYETNVQYDISIYMSHTNNYYICKVRIFFQDDMEI